MGLPWEVEEGDAPSDAEVADAEEDIRRTKIDSAEAAKKKLMCVHDSIALSSN